MSTQYTGFPRRSHNLARSPPTDEGVPPEAVVLVVFDLLTVTTRGKYGSESVAGDNNLFIVRKVLVFPSLLPLSCIVS